jgi:uncharacterized peroxidase-related enzyme
MARLTEIDPQDATGEARELLAEVETKIGMTPNMMRALANSPAALKAYVNFSEALGDGALDAKVREQIALTVGATNECEYCVSAHTAIGREAGLTEDDLAQAQEGTAADPKANAALNFARTVVLTKGEVTDADVRRLKEAGYTEGEIAEIVAHVGMNIFTNYFNHVVQTKIDFPKVSLVPRKTSSP